MEVCCPKCKKRTPYEGNPYRPFCSERCKMFDLGAWANEEYRVPVQEEGPSTDQGEPGSQDDSSKLINNNNKLN